ncbi:MAG: helix-turn-helix domain-containing protein [Gammaproteobacteria bacterium]|nr:helix-turn-helix domain-containing protein [Gammaproteobacteria bacterium]MBU1505801.1 helix-turn-helix domain-containing protein [Gammaproteobacteria bacterium]MBU2119489.1 helix-turn-helix domain-containing protein [Gammaproteobacteria bacterium]MBU2172605.1 helix-turn-helix domain-containing protein [Gammaproteobacteria bacterium]MBU2202063.1 helix-turn-helix domain-containing protein [Gammaproteobacteria bacterium]
MNQKIGIGERIRTERERLGLSQPAFAALGDASKNSQLSWEKEVAYPNARVLAAWAAVGADVAFILTGRTASNSLSSEEETLVGYFRAAEVPVRRAALGALLGAAQTTAPPGDVHMVSSRNKGGIQIGYMAGTVNKTK